MALKINQNLLNNILTMLLFVKNTSWLEHIVVSFIAMKLLPFHFCLGPESIPRVSSSGHETRKCLNNLIYSVMLEVLTNSKKGDLIIIKESLSIIGIPSRTKIIKQWETRVLIIKMTRTLFRNLVQLDWFINTMGKKWYNQLVKKNMESHYPVVI